MWWTGSERSRFGINLKIRVQSANLCLTNLCFRNPCFTICPQSLWSTLRTAGQLIMGSYEPIIIRISHPKNYWLVYKPFPCTCENWNKRKFIFLIVFVAANVTTGESWRALRFVDRVCPTFDKICKKNWRVCRINKYTQLCTFPSPKFKLTPDLTRFRLHNGVS